MKKSSIISIPVLLVGLAVACAIGLLIRSVAVEGARARAQALDDVKVIWFEQVVDEYIGAADVLGVAMQNSGGSATSFYSYSDKLISLYPSLNAVELSPAAADVLVSARDGKASRAEAELGRPVVRIAKERARATGEISVVEPMLAGEDLRSFVICKPLYFTRDNGAREFLGVATLLIGSDQLLGEVHFEALEGMAYLYRLSYKDGVTGKQVLVASTDGEPVDPISVSTNVHGTAWTLDLAPAEGWMPLWVGAFIALGLIAASVAAAILVAVWKAQRERSAELESQALQLEEDSRTDALTGILNRRGGDARMEALLGGGEGSAVSGVLMALDIDNFKSFNDIYGHEVGDEVLRSLASDMRAAFGPDGVYIRNGGDEFQAFVPDVDAAGARPAIEAFTLPGRHGVVVDGRTIEYNVSVGYAPLAGGAVSFSELCHRADVALYHVKQNGKGSFAQYDEAMEAQDRSGLGFNLAEFADGMPGALLVYKANAEEEILFGSRGLVELFECDSWEEFQRLTGSSFRNIVHPDDRERVEASIARQIASSDDKLDYVEYRIVTAKGNVREVEDVGRLVRNSHYGEIFYVFIFDKVLGDGKRA
ncbi:MAG: diguanylate cyclase [Olsenella sp.]|nr:diguanylate cyclase [Olsenella sp.]